MIEYPYLIPMPNLQKLRKIQANCQYSPAECSILYPWKELYRSLDSKAERLTLFKNDILPSMFNYWTTTGKLQMSPTETQL